MGTSMKRSARDDRGRLGASCAVLVCALALAGCADSLAGMSLPSMPKLDDVNPFAEKPVPLPGKRVAVIQQEDIATNLAGADKPITLPPPRENDSWAQPGGIPSNAPGHLAFAGATKSSWTADIGQGSTFFGRLTASPIVYYGKVYALDAAGTISAFNVSGGSVWRVSVTLLGEKDWEGFGGGLAADGGLGAHNPLSNGMAQAKGVAHGHDPVAHLDGVGIPQLEKRQFRRRIDDLDQGQVGFGVPALDGGLVFLASHQDDLDLIRAFHHVVIGYYVALRIDDEAGTETASFVALGAFRRKTYRRNPCSSPENGSRTEGHLREAGALFGRLAPSLNISCIWSHHFGT